MGVDRESLVYGRLGLEEFGAWACAERHRSARETRGEMRVPLGFRP